MSRKKFKRLKVHDSNKVLMFHDILVFKAFYFVKKILKSNDFV